MVVMALVAISAPPRVVAGDPPSAEVKLGLVQGLFRDVQPAMMQALARPFRELMQKQTGYTGDVEICADALTLAEKLKSKQVQLGVFHGFEFAWAQKKCADLIPLIITMPPGDKVQAFIVVGHESTVTSLDDLKDETVVIARGAKGHSLAFLDKSREGFAKTVARPLNRANLTAEDVLNGIAGGEFAAALVDSTSLEGYKTLQPGAFKQLKVLLKSEEVPAAVVAYRKGGLTDEQIVNIRTGMINAQKTNSGKMLMTMWNLKGFRVPPEDFQTHLDTILKAYPVPELKPLVSISPVSRQK